MDQKKEIATYRKVLDGPNPPALRVDYSHRQPLKLEEALLLANRREERLDIQGETYLQSLIQRDRAFSAFIPTISLAPTFAWQNKPLPRGVSAIGTISGTGTAATSTGPHQYTNVNVPLNAQMTVSGVRDVAAIRAAYANVGQQKLLLLDLQQTVMLDTAQTYYQVLLAERSVEVLSNSVQYQDARVRDMRGRLRAGIAQPLDLAQSEAQAAATRAQLTTAKNNVMTARATLAFLTNANVEDASLIDRLNVPRELPPIPQAVQIAESTRPDVAAAAAAIAVQRQNVQAALGQYYPSVSLNLNYYLHRETFPTNVEWTSLISANLPIFSAGTIEADVRAAWSTLRQAMLTQWQLLRQVRHDVTVAWETLDSSRRRIIDLRTEVAAAQEALRQASQRYSVGLAINLDVLNAEDQLLSSQLELATEEFNYKIYYLDLLRALGRLSRPQGLNSMSSGPTSRPTTEELQPSPFRVPSNQIPPMTMPSPTTAPVSPATQPRESMP